MGWDGDDIRLRTDEKELHGFWIDLGSGMVKDAIWSRIDVLCQRELEEVATSQEGKLYRDPTDGRYWERCPRRPELGESSPPFLAVLDADEARRRYELGA
ncbi:MAG: hypothetical protein C0621_03205 [Desulfuromonas sp.]|nr:MAG: hypothetical protein C0621_03205 [Desulfuromonas sp.]